MDPIHIHNLLRQLTNEVRCPHCDAKVRPDMITIENLGQDFCFLNISCYSCGEVFHGHAHVGVRISEEGISFPESDFATGKSVVSRTPPLLSEEDIATVRSLLAEPKVSSTTLFPPRHEIV